MIAAAMSTWVPFLEGDSGDDAQLLDKAMKERQLVMVPVVLAELLSDPNLPAEVIAILSEVPVVDIGSGYWQRAGVTIKSACEGTQSAARRRTDSPELYRPGHSPAYTRPGLPTIRRGRKSRTCAQ